MPDKATQTLPYTIVSFGKGPPLKNRLVNNNKLILISNVLFISKIQQTNVVFVYIIYFSHLAYYYYKF